MKVLIRVDAYPKIALGHLNRCINLGENLLEFGHDIIFICYEDSATKAVLIKTGFDFQLIPFKINDASNQDKELVFLRDISDSVDLFLVDSYNVDSGYFKRLNKFFSSMVYLDDLGLDFDVDMVINPSCTVKENDYIAKDVLCGMEYVILGNEYRAGRIGSLNTENHSILVTMGGIDHYDLSSRVIPILEEISQSIQVNMVIGPYYENTESIKAVVKNSSLEVNIFENVSNLSAIILKSNLALTAGGFTTYELAAMSTPSIGIALWDNQKNNVTCLSSQGALIPLYYTDGLEFGQQLKKVLVDLINNSNLRKRISTKARITVDGCGANRIAKEITDRYEKK